jgi:hypothetical protein
MRFKADIAPHVNVRDAPRRSVLEQIPDDREGCNQ